MGGFLGIGGSSAKTDRKTELTGFGDLQNIFNFGMDTSKSFLKKGGDTMATGLEGLSDSAKFFKTLMSGDRTAVTSVVAPETNAALARTDAARRNRTAMGTGRSGGTASVEQTEADRAMGEIDNFLFGVRPAAAQQVGEIGKTVAGLGLAEENLGLGFADLAETSAGNLTKLASESRKTSYEINQDTVGKVTGAIDAILKGLFA